MKVLKQLWIGFWLVNLSFLCSCTYTQYKPDERTPLGIKVVSSGIWVDHNLIDAKYLAVMQCYGVDPQKHIKDFYVYIVKDYKTLENGIQYWNCRSDDFKCAGQYDVYEDPSLTKVPPSLAALGHELGHMLAHFEFDGMHAFAEGGCAISHQCGDTVDSYFNKNEPVQEEWKPKPKQSPCLPFFP